MVLQNKSYKFRIYPNQDQEEVLAKMFGCSRFVWNYFLNLEKENHSKPKEEKIKNYLSYYDNAKTLTELKTKPEADFLKEVNSQSLQTTLKNLDIAYKRFFKTKLGFPKFKKKNQKQSFQIPQNLKIENNLLFIPKLKTGIKIVLHRKIQGKVLTSTISKSKTNKYYISICVEENIEQLPKANKSIGLDLGVKAFAVLSSGEEIKNNKFLTKFEKKLKKAQKHLAKKQKGSKRRERQKLKLAKIHEIITNQKQDFLQKLSTRLIHENQVICLEYLNVKGMLQNHSLAKSIQDCSWSSFITMLEYKAKWFGREIVFIDKFFPSSKTCSGCGWVNNNLELKDREWVCGGCGANHHRDFNAAKNILNQGMKILVQKSFGTDDYKHRGNVRPEAIQADLVEVLKVLDLNSQEASTL